MLGKGLFGRGFYPKREACFGKGPMREEMGSHWARALGLRVSFVPVFLSRTFFGCGVVSLCDPRCKANSFD